MHREGTETLISRFIEDVNKLLRNFLSLSELGCGF